MSLRHSFNYTWTSLYSRQLYNNSLWTAAVGDVGHGTVDLGLSDFWVTTERSALVDFTVPIGADYIELWVKRPDKDGRGTHPLSWHKVTRVAAFDLWRLPHICRSTRSDPLSTPRCSSPRR